MLSLLSGILCTVIGLCLILFGIAVLIIKGVSTMMKSKVSAPIAGAGIGLTSLFSYKKGYKDGMKNNLHE